MARKAAGPKTIAAGALAAPQSSQTFPLIEVSAGGSVSVIVDVGPMTVPYTVSYAGKTAIKGLVDRASTLPLLPGDHVLGWALAHLVKGWSHIIAVSVNGGAAVVLESMSEAKKDQDHSVNFAVIRLQE